MANCLSGCIADYRCGILHEPGPAGEQGESFAPLVQAEIIAGQSITVGNESYSADPNTAVIKSFELGFIDSPTAIIEIVDEAGGQMGALVNAINKCATSVSLQSKIKFQFGWIISDCNGNKKPILSFPFELVVLKVEISYSEGKIKYKIHGHHTGMITDHLREDFIIGTDDKKVSIEEAITQIYALPPAMKVRFCEQKKDGSYANTKFKWQKFPEDGGPKSVWQADNLARDAAVRHWLDAYRINDGTLWGKGIKLIDDTSNSETKILLVDPYPNPGEGAAGCDRGFGTYIVNGGKCSPVIEFSPTFNWISGVTNFSAGGGTSGPASTENIHDEDQKVEGAEKSHGATAGLQTQPGMTQQSLDSYGPKYAYTETMRSQQAHLKAANIEPGITAELRILGDPRQPFCEMPDGKTVSIVVINPFHIREKNKSYCGEWMATPGCNQILSNKNWKVQGINHSIKEGSYTTTLKLYLEAPGIQIGKNEPLGSQGSGGPTVKNTCP